MRAERFVGIDRVVVYGAATCPITIVCPDFVVDRLEISELMCAAFEVVDIKLGDVSLLEGGKPVMGETFRPGNEARFNIPRFRRLSFEGADAITLLIRNCCSNAREWSGTLYGSLED